MNVATTHRLQISLVAGAVLATAAGIYLVLHEPSDPGPARAADDQGCGPAREQAGSPSAGVAEPIEVQAVPDRCGPASLVVATAVPKSSHRAAERADIAVRITIADASFAPYLRLGVPADLDFPLDRPAVLERSKREFALWLERKQELATRLRAEYAAIAADADPVGAVTALSRRGAISASLRDALLASPIPLSVRTGDYALDKVDAYCDALTTVAEAIEPIVIDEYRACAESARRSTVNETDLGRVREVAASAESCFDELARIRPESWPALDEVLASAPQWELVSLQLRLGNHERAMQLLAASPPTSATDYDRENLRAVALRGLHRFDEARAAYRRAIDRDPARPEAYFNTGVLLAGFVATQAQVDDDAIFAPYREAIALFGEAEARATGQLRDNAARHAADARKVVAQLEAFIATRRAR